MSEPRHYFDFLKLPRELRDEIYEYTLCSFTQPRRRYDIEECAAVCSGAVFETRRFTGNLNLLLANKQTHEEGYECMFEKNLFVLVECQHNMLETLIYGHLPYIPILNHRPYTRSGQDHMNAYPWYVMRLKIEEKFGPGSEVPMRPYPEVVMLLEDCADMFKRFGVYLHKDLLPDPKGRWKNSCQPLRIEVELNPKRRQKKKSQYSETSYANLRRSYPDIDQRKLLEHVKDGFRDCSDFDIKNCDDATLAADVTEAVSRCHSLSLDTLCSHMESHARRAEASLQAGDITECANICAEGIELVQRIRSNGALMLKLREDGLRNRADVGEPSYKLHRLLALCTFAYLPTLMGDSAENNRDMRIASITRSIKDLVYRYDLRAYGFLPRYRLSVAEHAEACYMGAKNIRLGLEYATSSFNHEFMDYIQTAVRLQPENLDYKEELEKAIRWERDYTRYLDWLRETDCQEFLGMSQWREEVDHTKYLS